MFKYFRERGFIPYLAFTIPFVFIILGVLDIAIDLAYGTQITFIEYLSWDLPIDPVLSVVIAISCWYFPGGQPMIHRSKAVTTLDLNDLKDDDK